jgi:SAM-dependent methyltransferase
MNSNQKPDLKDDDPRDNTYMYGSASLDIETARLIRLNKLHNPHTMKNLAPFISGRKKILEIGCGTGLLAAEVLAIAEKDVEFVAVDKDPYQVNTIKKNLSEHKNATIMELDLTGDIAALNDIAPFDLIYCRWVLVHFPEETRINILKTLLSLLAPKGIFICDECDNRTVTYRSIGSSTSDYNLATKMWGEISIALMKEYGTDYRLSPEKLSKQIMAAADNNGSVKLLGTYQIVFTSQRDKMLISDGFRSSAAAILASMGKDVEEVVKPFDDCAKDNMIEVDFLTENVIAYELTEAE